MPDTTLRATTAQMRNLLIAALGSTGVLLILGCVGRSSSIAVAFIIVAAVSAMVFLPMWLIYLAAYVRLDDFGITTRLFRRHSCNWRDVAAIRIRETVSPSSGRSYTVRVQPRRGPEFALAVPVDGGLMKDREFRARVGIVETAWRYHGGRTIAVTR